MDNNPLNYTVSLHYDRRLYSEDIAGSIVHALMLGRQGIITDDDSATIVDGLKSICEEIRADEFPWRTDLEDIHMNIENRLFQKIGEVAGKLHTGRSRNDQIAVDMRLYSKKVTGEVIAAINDFRAALIKIAELNISVIMPGYTHMQRAQPVLFAHHMLAYFEMLNRDVDRFKKARARADVLPLGSGALAGVPYPIDRKFMADELGFASVSSNSMDAVSDRDFLLDFHAASAICAMHVSRLAEEMVLWSSEEFAFISLGDDYTTGSSIMPQKRNPDFAELARGKTGRVFGNLIATLTVLKGLPLSYNRDIQEDKEAFFDTVDTLIPTLRTMGAMVSTLELREDHLRKAAEEGYLLATDLADYLVAKGMPFREAHGIASRISVHAQDNLKGFGELTLDTYKEFSDLFEQDVLAINVDSSVKSRDVHGGTNQQQVLEALKRSKTKLEEDCG